MSLNQLTQRSAKQWLIAKTYDLTVDGLITVTNPNSRAGDILTCTEPGVAKFVPVNTRPNISVNYYYLTTPGNMPSSGQYNVTAFAGYANPDFTISGGNDLNCVNAGVYWVTKKITINSPANGGVKAVTTVNGVPYDYSSLNIQWNTVSQSYGLVASYLLVLAAGDIVRESYFPSGTSYQTDVLATSSNIQFVKIG